MVNSSVVDIDARRLSAVAWAARGSGSAVRFLWPRSRANRGLGWRKSEFKPDDPLPRSGHARAGHRGGDLGRLEAEAADPVHSTTRRCALRRRQVCCRLQGGGSANSSRPVVLLYRLPRRPDDARKFREGQGVVSHRVSGPEGFPTEDSGRVRRWSSPHVCEMYRS